MQKKRNKKNVRGIKKCMKGEIKKMECASSNIGVAKSKKGLIGFRILQGCWA